MRRSFASHPSVEMRLPRKRQCDSARFDGGRAEMTPRVNGVPRPFSSTENSHQIAEFV